MHGDAKHSRVIDLANLAVLAEMHMRVLKTCRICSVFVSHQAHAFCVECEKRVVVSFSGGSCRDEATAIDTETKLQRSSQKSVQHVKN